MAATLTRSISLGVAVVGAEAAASPHDSAGCHARSCTGADDGSSLVPTPPLTGAGANTTDVTGAAADVASRAAVCAARRGCRSRPFGAASSRLVLFLQGRPDFPARMSLVWPLASYPRAQCAVGPYHPAAATLRAVVELARPMMQHTIFVRESSSVKSKRLPSIAAPVEVSHPSSPALQLCHRLDRLRATETPLSVDLEIAPPTELTTSPFVFSSQITTQVQTSYNWG